MPLSTLSTAREIRGLLYNADAEHLISAQTYRGRDLGKVLTEALEATPGEDLRLLALPVLRNVWLGLNALEQGDPHDPTVAAAEAEVTPADLMAIVHTSGSTSAPKGVMHTHGQVLRNMRRLNAIRDYDAEDGLFSNSPFFWIGGLAYSLLATYVAGARLICSGAEPAAMLDLLEAEQPNMCNGVASTVLSLARDQCFAARDLSFLRRGNLYPIMPEETRPADPELRYNLLGMTEAGSVCLIGRTEADLEECKRGAFGSPVPGITARVVDPETGTEGAYGELWMRGPNVMQGYDGLERWQCFDDEGWLHTGDMMRVDDGDFFFLGRTGDIIRTSGAQVSPREVEGAISDATGGRLAIVIGTPDPERGQIVTAIMVGGAALNVAELTAQLRQRLSPYKVPRRFVQMREQDLPTLSSGKIDLKRLAEIARDR